MALIEHVVTIATLITLIDSSPSGKEEGCTPAAPSGCIYRTIDDLPTVTCNYINIQSIPQCLPGKTHPKKLIINGNNITQITSIRFDTLEYLYLVDDNVSNVVLQAFRHLSKLKVLSLKNNFITNIQRDTFIGLTSLKELYLTNNSIKALPEQAFFYKYLPRLKILDLNKNLIESVSNTAFVNLTVLSELNLRENKLVVLPKFRNTSLDLDVLDLGQNQLSEIPHEAFNGLKYLETLSLDHNKIITLPHSAFWGLDHLKIIHLENNRLSHLWYHLFLDPWESILEVYLHSNTIAVLNPTQLPWEQLHVLTLDDNAWICSCSTTWMKSLKVIKTNSTSVICARPSEVQGQNLLNLDDTALHCHNNRVSVPGIIVGVLISLALLVTVGYLLYRCVKRRSIRLASTSVYRRMGGRRDNQSNGFELARDSTVNEVGDDEL